MRSRRIHATCEVSPQQKSVRRAAPLRGERAMCSHSEWVFNVKEPAEFEAEVMRDSLIAYVHSVL